MWGLNVEVGKNFKFGPVVKPPPGAPVLAATPGKKVEVQRRYNVEFAVNSQNVFNHVNYAAPVGVLNSPLFGKFTGIANGNGASNRVVQVETFFRF